MKTKTQIVQELLDEKKITADDAVILLMGEPKYIPYAQPYPVYPYYPIFPSWQYYPTISHYIPLYQRVIYRLHQDQIR